MGSDLFPSRSVVNMETLATFGITFFLFAIGLRMDPKMIIRPERKAVVLAMACIFVTMIFTVPLSLIVRARITMDDTLATALPYLAAAQSLTPFSNVTCLLIELKMASTEVGQLASATAVVADVVGIIMTTVIFALIQSDFDLYYTSLSVGSALLFVAIMAGVVKPVVARMVRRMAVGKPLREHHVFFCFFGALVSCFVSETIGQHFTFGPVIFGIVIPDGPVLGSPIVSKLDLPVGKFLYPTFLTTSGLKTNFFTIDFRSFAIMAALISFSCAVKIAGIVAASRFLGIDTHDSIIIGLILSVKGVCELLIYNLWRDGGVRANLGFRFFSGNDNPMTKILMQILTDQEFALSVMSVVGVTAIVTPLIRWLYDPTRRRVPLKKRTIQHSKREAELRILVCIQDQDNVPSIVNILQASNATEASPIAVIAVVLEELVGGATNILVAHQSTRTLQPNSSRSGHIINALRQYELCNETCVTVQSFSAVSHAQTAHDDLCRLALDQNATVIILPFHKHWEIDGTIGLVNKPIQNMNIKIAEKAPCSVAILVDRGILNGSVSILNNQLIYRVAIIYIGGADDAEALSYAARMGGHCNVSLTVVRYLLYGSDSARERKIDNHLIDEVRQANMENQNFIYQEQVVKDGVGLASSLRTLENHYDLFLVGRKHHSSQILMGFGAWIECPELGVIGDLLSSTDFGSRASVLVVQQQRLEDDKLKSRMAKPVVVSHESLHDSTAGFSIAPNLAIAGAS
ncbi:cation proton exchanger [Genlisea aurea]|uniref:Cation proton exchanger n=1 Tax=Genlisea aurea TaxID=192259 RepID=S8D861_9LAMI|nr:cation proton exchanger [Genlisea aurea]